MKKYNVAVVGATGLVGSTFLKVLSGDIDSTSGDIVITDNERLSVLKQNHNAYDIIFVEK